MRLPFFTRKFLERLQKEASTNLAKYGKHSDWVELVANGQTYFRESGQVVDPPPTLLFGSGKDSTSDAENARRVFTWLEQLPPSVAMEERLWAYLAHCTFPEYMAARWPATDERAVLRRYLFEGQSFAALSRHGIARLWWAGYLTKDKARANPFELTTTLFSRQDIQVAVLERSIGKCQKVRTAVLEFLAANHDWLAEASFGRRIQVLVRELNLLGGVMVLDALTPEAVQGFLASISAGFSKDATDGTAKGLN